MTVNMTRKKTNLDRFTIKWDEFIAMVWLIQLQPQEISPPPTANLDRSNDKVYENVTGLVKAVIEMSNRIQPAAPEEYVPMVKVLTLLP